MVLALKFRGNPNQTRMCKDEAVRMMDKETGKKCAEEWTAKNSRQFS